MGQKLAALQANLQEEKDKTYSLNPNHNIEALKPELETLKTELGSQPECTAKTTLISSCDKAIAICSELLADDPPEDVTAQHQQLADQITEVDKVTFASQDQGMYIRWCPNQRMHIDPSQCALVRVLPKCVGSAPWTRGVIWPRCA